MTDDDTRPVALRRRLADELDHAGVLRSPQWRRAVERVPRHEFVPEFFQRIDTPDRGTLWAPVSSDDTGRWLDLVYQDETLVTQLDRHVTPHEVTEPIAGDPTSSSTLPGLVVRMLEDLDVTDGMTVLEIGTGTGYSTALLCQRLGDGQVTSIEVDAAVAANAAAALRRAGYAPHLLVGDGLAGDPGGGLYDRVIATCSVRCIPSTWLAQTRPGGRILVTVGGWLHGYALASLVVAEDGSAEGRILPGTISFMIARPQAPPPIDPAQWDKAIQAAADAEPRPATVGADIRREWTGNLLTQLAAPAAQWQARRVDGGPWIEHFLDVATGSCASLTPEPDGGWTVRQSGPVRLWDDVEHAITTWRAAGSPGHHHFRLHITGDRQRIHHPDVPELSFDLPCS
jgi:methyltransferase of ATP-grasp peptide maturase system